VNNNPQSALCKQAILQSAKSFDPGLHGQPDEAGMHADQEKR
jgi:hypothetical protein